MFAALEIKEREKDILSRLSGFFSKSSTQAQSVGIPSGAPFLLISSYLTKHGVNWDEVNAFAGNYAKKMLLPEGCTAPEGSGIVEFEPALLPLKLCFGSAVRILSASGAAANRLKLVVHDPEAALTRELEKTVMCASDIFVITKKPPAYGGVKEKFMRKYGAYLNVSDSIPQGGCDVLVCADKNTAQMCRAKAVVCPKSGVITDKSYGSERTIECRGISADEKITALCPEGINRDLFLCAVYELCGVRGVDDSAYTELYSGGIRISEYRAGVILRGALE